MASVVLGPAVSRPPAVGRRLRTLRIVGAGAVLALLVAGCAGGDGNEEAATPRSSSGPVIEDPGPVHVHGLGINPKDGALFLATHTGLFRSRDGGRPRRVAGRFQDTMGFTVIGPDRFLGSGHPDGREKLPPFLGLIRSQDAGEKWTPVSLLGKRDFHVLEAAGEQVYGFGTDFASRRAGLLVSDDAGKSWDKRATPEALLALAIDPRDPQRIVASGKRGLYLSTNSARRWRPIEGPSGLLAWTDDGLIVAAPDGSVHSARGPDERFSAVGQAGGGPAVLDSGPDGELLVALHSGVIKSSPDGRRWTVRSRPSRG